jgi:hypothetical protein
MGNAFKKFRMNMFGIFLVIVLTDKHTYRQTHIHTHCIHTYNIIALESVLVTNYKSAHMYM